MNLMRAGWLDDLTQWLKDLLKTLFDALLEFLADWIIHMLKMWLELFYLVFSQLQPPDFLTSHSIGGLLGQAGPTIGWIASTFQLGTAFALIGAGYVFRLIRKAITLGQW